MASGLEAVIRIAQTFSVTVDYLLIDNVEDRPLAAPSNHVDARLADLDQLTDDERATIANVIDALVTKSKTPRDHRRSQLSYGSTTPSPTVLTYQTSKVAPDVA